MGELHVSEQVVSSVAKELRGAAVEARSGLSNLDAELGGLLGSGWTGQAGSAFGEVWKRWHDGANDMVRGLESMAGLLEEAAQSYGQTDAAGRGAIDSAGM